MCVCGVGVCDGSDCRLSMNRLEGARRGFPSRTSCVVWCYCPMALNTRKHAVSYILTLSWLHCVCAVIGQLVCGESDKVTRERLDQLVIDCDGAPPTVSLDDLFPGDTTTSSLDIFESWLCTHKSLASFSAWLLGEGGGLILEGPPDPPTFHQTLAGRYGVDQQVIMDLEKCYWSLKGGSGKFDLSTLTSYVNPPLPDDLCEGGYNSALYIACTITLLLV